MADAQGAGQMVEHPETREQVEVRVRACGPADRAEQVLLFNRCFKKPIEERGLRWRYDENPHGEAVSFVSRPGEHPGVSGYACSPRRALVAGDESTLGVVGETGDVMTDPAWRKRGLFSALDRAAMEESARRGWVFAFGLPNRRSAHIFLELGWERIGSVRPWTFVLRAGAAARNVRRTDGRLAVAGVGWAAFAGRRARARLRAGARGLATRGIEERFPDEVLEIARAVEPRFGFMVRRDPEYLTWRFLRGPSGLHRCLGVHRADGRLEGYAVVQLPRPGESLGYLVDVLGRDQAAVHAAIEAGLSSLEAGGAEAVQSTALDGSWWMGELRRASFRPPKPDNHLIVILHPHAKDHPLVAAARRTAEWYFTDGDRDDETMG